MCVNAKLLNECLKFAAVDFFNQINMLYGTITEFCTEESCAIMSAGPKYEYHWADGQSVKKPIKCSAPKYIDYLMTWVQDQLDDEALFPSKIGTFLISSAEHLLKTHFCCRSSFSKKFSHHCQNNFEEVVPSLCTFVSPALLRGDATGGGSSPQHIIQAFHFLCPGNKISQSLHLDGDCLLIDEWAGSFARD